MSDTDALHRIVPCDESLEHVVDGNVGRSTAEDLGSLNFASLLDELYYGSGLTCARRSVDDTDVFTLHASNDCSFLDIIERR